VPAEIGDRMERVLTELMQRQDVQDRIGNYGLFYRPMTRAAFNRLVVDQVELWRPWIVAAGVAGQ
jgi:tripartite-type tricarboxylate transporter receptor subunit TctC